MTTREMPSVSSRSCRSSAYVSIVTAPLVKGDLPKPRKSGAITRTTSAISILGHLYWVETHTIVAHLDAHSLRPRWWSHAGRLHGMASHAHLDLSGLRMFSHVQEQLADRLVEKCPGGFIGRLSRRVRLDI